MRARRIIVATVLGTLLVGWLVERARDRSLEFPVLPERRTAEWEPPRARADTRTLTGRVLHHDGQPAVEATVLWSGPRLSSFDDTDANGRFELRGLPAGPLTLDLLVWNALPTTLTVAPDATDVTLTMRAPRPDVGELPKVERANLTGVVVPSEGRGGYEVLIEPEGRRADAFDPRLPRRAVCEGDGTFTVTGLVHGPYRVRLLPPWARGGGWPNLLTPGRRFVHPRERLTLVVEGGSIVGQATASDGNPIAGALMLLNDAQRPERVWEPRMTGPDGRYRFDDLPPGTYELELAAGQAVERRGELEVKTGALLDVPFSAVTLRLAE